MHEPSNEANLSDIRAALAALTPAPPAIDRDAILYRAGQASMKRGWAWPATSGVLATVAAVLGTMLVLQPKPDPLHETPLARVDVPASPVQQGKNAMVRTARTSTVDVDHLGYGRDIAEYRMVQDQLLRWGLDALPSPPRLVAETVSPLQSRPTQTLPTSPGLRWFQFMFDSGERL